MNETNTRANKLVIFQSKKIRRIWYEEDWYYSVVDIIAALTESPTPRQYWEKIKQREFIKLQLSPIWDQQLKLETSIRMANFACFSYLLWCESVQERHLEKQ